MTLGLEHEFDETERDVDSLSPDKGILLEADVDVFQQVKGEQQ